MCKFSEITCYAAPEGRAVHCKALPPANIIQSNNHSSLPTWIDIVPEKSGFGFSVAIPGGTRLLSCLNRKAPIF
jgi:hypothetical protein